VQEAAAKTAAIWQRAGAGEQVVVDADLDADTLGAADLDAAEPEAELRAKQLAGSTHASELSYDPRRA